MHESYSVSYPQYIDGDDVEEFARSVGDYAGIYRHGPHLERDAVRTDDPFVPIPMLAGYLTGAIGQLSHYIEGRTKREADVIVRDIDLTTEREVTAPVSLMFMVELSERPLEITEESPNAPLDSIIVDVDVRVERTIGRDVIATGTVSALVDFLEDK